MVPTTSLRHSNSSGRLTTMSFGTRMSCKATRMSCCFLRLDPLTGMTTTAVTGGTTTILNGGLFDGQFDVGVTGFLPLLEPPVPRRLAVTNRTEIG